MAEDVTGSLVSVRIDFLCPTVVACDFFTVYSSFGKTIYVLFLIELSSRRVHLAGCTARPNNAWVTQQARNFSMALADAGSDFRFLIHDRDTKFTAAFDDVFRTDGIRIIKTPVRAPRANAVAERWIKSARTDFSTGCLSSESATSDGRSASTSIITIAVGHTDH